MCVFAGVEEQVHVVVPVVKQLKPVHWLDVGLVKRIRGVAYSTRVSPQNANRMVRRQVASPQ